jgi:uncharacterized protein YqhQ
MRVSNQRDEPHLGGMALANGLLVHGPTHWAAAIRTADGSLTVSSGEKPRLSAGPLGGVPLVRGVLKMAESLAVVPTARLRTPGARLATESGRVIAAMVGSAAVTALVRRTSRSVLAQEFVGAAAGLIPALVALRDGEAAVWHGVEHKSIAAYESGGPREVANAAAYPKEHDRCGSNLVVPLIGATVAINTVVRTLAPRAGVAVRAAGSALAVGVTVELFAFANRHPDHPVARSVHRIGRTIQATFATREPGPAELAVGRAAMDEILRLEGVTAAG